MADPNIPRRMRTPAWINAHGINDWDLSEYIAKRARLRELIVPPDHVEHAFFLRHRIEPKSKIPHFLKPNANPDPYSECMLSDEVRDTLLQVARVRYRDDHAPQLQEIIQLFTEMRALIKYDDFVGTHSPHVRKFQRD